MLNIDFLVMAVIQSTVILIESTGKELLYVFTGY